MRPLSLPDQLRLVAFEATLADHRWAFAVLHEAAGWLETVKQPTQPKHSHIQTERTCYPGS